VLATTPVFELRGVRYRHPGRKTDKEFTVMAAPSWVNVLALTPAGHLVLVSQFRFGINDISLEIPGGVMHAGEDPVKAAQRVLTEETGYAGTSAKLLGSVRPNPAIQNNRCHMVLVENAELRSDSAWDDDEEIAVTTAPVDEVLGWARSGRISHALVLNALFYFEPIWRARRGV
jgi:8-oxo-dGTP pyrophosphatase MutT (NUDIX family)